MEMTPAKRRSSRQIRNDKPIALNYCLTVPGVTLWIPLFAKENADFLTQL
jgi:hypothetical protein